MDFITKHKYGLIGTIVFHIIILIILMMFGFFTPLPLPGEEGIFVNFGNEDNGAGMEEPAPTQQLPEPVQQEEQQEQVVTPPPPPAPKVTQPQKAQEEIMTQDLEKTAALESAKKKEEAKKKEDAERQKKIKEQQEQERIERQQKEDAERKKREEIAKIEREKQAQRQREEAERKKKEEEQRKATAINDRAKNAFGTSGAGSPDSKSTGQGVTFPGGNQGSPKGSANSDNYNKGGGEGNGVSYSLGGRSAMKLSRPNYPGNEQGKVVVQVTVDKNGKVTKATAGAKGSTTMVPELLAAAQKAALLAEFNVDKNAPEEQQGTITYKFSLD